MFYFENRPQMPKVMTRFIFFVSLLLSCSLVQAQFQQFGSTKSLRKNFLEFGFNPFVMVHNGANPDGHRYSGVNVVGGIGVHDQVDFRLTAGVLMDNIDYAPEDYNPNNYYLGVEMEGQVVSTGKSYEYGFELNVGGGVHVWQDHAGFDGTAKFGFRASRAFHIYTGIDADLNFLDRSIVSQLPFRLQYRAPVGLEITPNGKVSIVMEGDIPLTQYDHIVIGGGLRFYFKK